MARENPPVTPLRYRSLLSHLPGMAAVVNSFQSDQVQIAVYEALMTALASKLDAEEGVVRPRTSRSATGEIDLLEGESIHTMDRQRESAGTATVF